ncbi:gliding motility-associated C-terminal domain-containing protein [Psychroserpens sp. XS_ASV72]|uniref:DUF7933 domain-containing protein n=1 Tax=Psychroserpens sp. XS_ASV72 TaxID=3241293 RepID=UPI0035187A75
MPKNLFCLILFVWLSCIQGISQTTNLGVLVEAQNTSNSDVSQVHIYQEFQYIITILNSGDLVENATFTQSISPTIEVTGFEYQNPSGGAGIVTDFFLDPNTNELSGTISTLPSSSSIEVKVSVVAPTEVGGVATSVTVYPPEGVSDVDETNNQSIISIDITDVDIDFIVELNQISPLEGTPINAWGDDVTYQFTITNNSAIAFPLESFKMNMRSNPVENGEPDLQIQSITCLNTTNGVECPDDIPFETSLYTIDAGEEIFEFGDSIVFPIDGTITIEVVVKFFEGDCAETPDVINIESNVEMELNHENLSSNQSNLVNTLLLIPEACLVTDLAIITEVIQPSGGGISDWSDVVIFETTVYNLGTFDVLTHFFLQNLTSNAGSWNIISVTCTETTGTLDCSDVTFSLNGNSWNTNNFDFPPGSTIVVETVLNYVEPDCSPNPTLYTSQTRSAINIIPDDVIDIDYSNNFDDDYVVLIPVEQCPFSDMTVTKTQVSPELPLGGSDQDPMPWGDVTYEITASNIGDEDTFMTLTDVYSSVEPGSVGVLRSVECVSASGGANCGTISIQNIDIEIDQASEDQTFWEITQEDGWFMPSGATVTFRSVHSWIPNCDVDPIPVINTVSVGSFDGVPDGNSSNNTASVTTFFTPCVDLLIQTFPSVSTIPINSNFNWVVDITNSNNSSAAIDAAFSNTLNSVFTIAGPPTCQIENGNATCINSFDVTGSTISGTIPFIDAGSTIRILIPVTAPSYGGVFNNTAEVFPSAINNEEITPGTNVSISSAQIISPVLQKSYNPETIYVGYESTLTFTIHNLATNPSQTEISFTDNLGSSIYLTGMPEWVESNGCTATFLGTVGDQFVGVTDLAFPEGVDSCTFSVQVTSDSIGSYVNDHSNFTNQNNIDTTQTTATLNVLEDTTNVDIQVLKSVSQQTVSLFDEVSFLVSATNIGTTSATNIALFEDLPSGYQYLSHSVSSGSFNNGSNIWSIPLLDPNQSESLTLNVRVVSNENLTNTALLNSVNEIDRNDSNNSAYAETIVNNCLDVSEGLSPNGDGSNDVFYIPCIELYPENRLDIYNRYGTLIYQTRDYKNDWQGIANRGLPQSNKRLPVGTYFYILQVSDDTKPIVGWVYLNY